MTRGGHSIGNRQSKPGTRKPGSHGCLTSTGSFTNVSRTSNSQREFIGERIENDEADIFAAIDGDKAIGFTQLYPSFCSVDAAKIYILYDLYVDADSRNTGVGAKIMNRATDWARENGAARLDLLTENNNLPGQHLYEKLGYKRTNEEFFAYSLAVK